MGNRKALGKEEKIRNNESKYKQALKEVAEELEKRLDYKEESLSEYNLSWIKEIAEKIRTTIGEID